MHQRKIVSAFLLLLPISLLAHGSHGNGIMAGFTHPIFGFDHAAAIVGIGFLGYLIDQSKWYYYLAAFLLPMIIGGMLGIGNEATVLVEKIIAFSVIAAGILIAMNSKMSQYIIFAALVVFGFFHVFAHGAEMPASTTALQYVSGFALGTIFIASLGMLVARLTGSEKSKSITQMAAGLFMGLGFMFLIL